MFLENDYARPLFDFEKGGKAKAFECLMSVNDDGWRGEQRKTCGRITRTERGMRMHLKQVHNWKEQPCLYSTESQTDQNSGQPRKLRAGRPSFQKVENEQPSTESLPVSQKSAEMKEGALRKPTKEGN